MAAGGESLESWLNKATDPSNRKEDWEYIMGFCDQINKELEGPQIATRLLVHKIHSPQEREAQQALMVLEACMKNCGQRFQNEVGKFRFLNELIKVISPKYLGDKVSDKVKSKVIEMIYGWTIYLPEETKICEAYQMLKSQGIVLADPEISLDATLATTLSSERPKNPVFDDEHKGRKLAELLKSKKPADLREANRLIKNMVKEDEVRSQKLSKQQSTLEAVNNSVRLLNEMLAYFSPEDSTESEKDLIRELYADCDKLRQSVCQLATETDDDDTNLGDILQANDDLSKVLQSCKKIVEGTGCTAQSESLIDLTDADVAGFSRQREGDWTPSTFSHVDLLCGSSGAAPCPAICGEVPVSLSLLDEELLTLGSPGPVRSESAPPTSMSNFLQSVQNYSQDVELLDSTCIASPAAPISNLGPGSVAALSSLALRQTPISPAGTAPPRVAPLLSTTPLTSPHSSGAVQHSPWAPSSLDHSLQDLALLDLGSPKSIPGADLGSTRDERGGLRSPANHLRKECAPATSAHAPAGSVADRDLLCSASPLITHRQTSFGGGEETSLADVFVPLDAVKPSKVRPITAYDKAGVRVLLHFARDCPPGRPDVLVIVASMLNTSPLAVRDVVLQAAVPKTMKVKLQPPSGTQLAPFIPVLPPAAITQVVLLANPHKEKVRMRYKLTFTLSEQPFTEVGEVNEFPPPDRWGDL
ncbi:ADP-ribosylation factor-binding protein GGA3a isoform X2 [Syngnathoides biaculeatus]|uniref:ADP-ribosylation factor-binding protein GGA3a isoform X2 n=1 Tax=Syngnathoides biaculeatus TaxID=300417 RepID=UPI002ADD7A3E|nr:ADP-ribosylation factor-binding protein GGA3a isoform X2 [Syngnathoides biaculeatus]